MKSIIGGVYAYFLTMPDRLYPFASVVGGKRVRGMRSYNAALKRAVRRYGFGREGYRLALYREAFHFMGSLIFIVAATLIAKNFFGSDVALYVLLALAVLALSYQEFYLHPRRLGQHPGKSIADWVVWVAPMALYLFWR